MSSIKPLNIEDEYDVWERQPDEDVKHFAAFQYYLSLGHKGKIYEVANKFEYESPSLLYHVSNNNRWQERRKAWLDHLNEVRIEEFENTIKEMARRQAANAMLIESASMLPVKALLTKIQKEKAQGIDTFSNMSVDQLLKWSMEAARIHPATVTSERLSRNQATEISKGEMTVEHVQVILPQKNNEVE